jgi:hypothetical protein
MGRLGDDGGVAETQVEESEITGPPGDVSTAHRFGDGGDTRLERAIGSVPATA